MEFTVSVKIDHPNLDVNQPVERKINCCNFLRQCFMNSNDTRDLFIGLVDAVGRNLMPLI